MLNSTQWSVITGFGSAILVFATTLIRHKRLDRTDLGALGATFFAGYNIPAALFLCYYVFNPDPPDLLMKTKLFGYEKYLSFSGGALLFLSLVSIGNFLESAYKVPQAAAQNPVPIKVEEAANSEVRKSG
jgi:hypothetical protein